MGNFGYLALFSRYGEVYSFESETMRENEESPSKDDNLEQLNVGTCYNDIDSYVEEWVFYTDVVEHEAIIDLGGLDKIENYGSYLICVLLHQPCRINYYFVKAMNKRSRSSQNSEHKFEQFRGGSLRAWTLRDLPRCLLFENTECKQTFELNECSIKDSTISLWKFSNRDVCCKQSQMIISVSYDTYLFNGGYVAVIELTDFIYFRLVQDGTFKSEQHITEWVIFDYLMVGLIIHTDDLEIQVILVMIVYANEERFTLNVENISSLKNSISSISYFDKFMTEIGVCTYELDTRIMCKSNDRCENT